MSIPTRVVSSSPLGQKSKFIKARVLYMPTDKGTELQNIYELKSKYNDDDGIDKYIENFPTDKVKELIDYCIAKRVTEIHFGIKDPNVYSHAYVLASYIDPDEGEFEINTSGTTFSFKGNRDFIRFLRVTNLKMRHELEDRYKTLDRKDLRLYGWRESEWNPSARGTPHEDAR